MSRLDLRLLCSLCFAVLCLSACSASETSETSDAGITADAPDAAAPTDAPDAADAAPAMMEHVPTQPPTADLSAPRQWRVVRGIIHSHTPYSHDACDGKPRGESGEGPIDEDCLSDYRHGVCTTHQDFVFNTDHEESAAWADFDDLLLVRGDDEVITEGGFEVANRMKCDDGFRPLIMPGGEFGVMPVGLTHHIDGDAQQREQAYEEVSPERVSSLKALGAVVLQAHTESKDLDTLRDLGLDGFEIYNLHANLDPDIRENFLGLEPLSYLADLYAFIDSDVLPPDLAFLSFWGPNQPALDTFDTLLAEGQHLVGTAGTDSHQNVIQSIMSDGERPDSFRRMMRWFSNHLLVEEVTPAAIKDALRAGRGYVTFEILGTPDGFDFRADAAGEVTEMGDTVALADAPQLVVERPSVYGFDGAIEVTLRIVRAAEGGGEVVASGSDTLTYTPDKPGAYRAEVDLHPSYLRDLLTDEYKRLADKTFTWIYANPIYVQ